MKRLLMTGFLLFSVSCTEDNPGFVPDPQLPGECRAGEEVDEVFEQFERSSSYDILFVVDNSGDTGELQTVLRDAIPAFLTVFEDEGKDVRVGVTTSDPNATTLASPGDLAEGCAGNNNRTPQSGEQERWKEIAACNVVLEQTEDRPDAIFTTIQKAVLSGENFDFWRGNSRKLIVAVTRDDDCSSNTPITGDRPREECLASQTLTDVSNFVDFVSSNSVVPEGLTVAFLAGPASQNDGGRPVCNSRVGPVYAGNRIQEAVDGLGPQSLIENVCSEDLTPALQSIANTVISKGTSLCAGREMAHEPLRVVGIVDGEESEVRVGTGGFVFLGSQPECENGVMIFEDDTLEEIEVTYCAL